MQSPDNKLIALLYESVSNHAAWREIIHLLDTDSKRLSELETLLAPHLSQASELSQHVDALSSQRTIMQQMADVLPMPVIMCDSQGALLSSNQRGGEFLSRHEEWIESTSFDESVLLRKALKDLFKLHDGSSPHVCAIPSQDAPCQQRYVWIVPTVDKPGTSTPGNFAIIPAETLGDTSRLRTQTSHAALINAFKLTEAESRLVIELVTGASTNEASEALGISYQTARSQLKSVFQKTNCKRQAELMIRCLQVLWPCELTKLHACSTQSEPIRTTVQLGKNRSTVVTTRGNPDDYPVFYYKSITGTALAYLEEQDLIEAGIYLLIVDRPGLGLTSPLQNRSYERCAGDLVEIADQLEIENFSVMGYGIGSAYALAAGQYFPNRIDTVISVSGSAPYQTGKAFGYGRFFGLLTRLAELSPTLFRQLIAVISRAVKEKPDNYFSVVQQDAVPERDFNDLKIFNDPAVKQLSREDLGFIVQQGSHHLTDDILQVVQTWGFDITEIPCRTLIWHGQVDTVIPIEHARYLNEHIPYSELRVVPEQGYLMLMNRWPEILQSIKPQKNHKQPYSVASIESG